MHSLKGITLLNMETLLYHFLVLFIATTAGKYILALNSIHFLDCCMTFISMLLTHIFIVFDKYICFVYIQASKPVCQYGWTVFGKHCYYYSTRSETY